MTTRTMRLAVVLASTLVLLPLLARSAGAAMIVTAARPVAPAVGYSSWDGSFLALWAEDRGTGTGLDLYAARLNSSGVVVGGEVPVVLEAGNQSDPALVWSEHNRAYLVIYTDDGATGPALPGTPVVPVPGGTTQPTPGLPIPGGTPTSVVPPPPPLPLGPSDLPEGAWSFRSEDLERADLAPGAVAGLRRGGPAAFGPDQAPTVFPPTPGPPPTGVPPLATPTLPLPGPTATSDPSAPAPPTTAGLRDLRGTWITLSGARVTNTFPVVSSPADDTYPSLGYVRRPDGDEYALVWRAVTGMDASIKAMRLDGWGFYFVPSSTFSVAAGGDLGRPSVAGEATEGDWFVVWSQTPATDPARDVFGRRMNSNGVPYGTARLVAGGASDQAYPSIGSLGASGGYILTWENRMPGEAPDIRVRRLNQNGVPYALETELAGGAPFSFAPNIASSDAATTVIVWLDRNAAGDHSVLASVVSRDGRRRGVERLIVQGGAGPAAVTPVVPQPGLPTLPVPFPPLPPVPTGGPGPTATPPSPPILPTP